MSDKKTPDKGIEISKETASDFSDLVEGFAEHLEKSELATALEYIDTIIDITKKSNSADTGKRYNILHMNRIRKLLLSKQQLDAVELYGNSEQLVEKILDSMDRACYAEDGYCRDTVEEEVRNLLKVKK